MGLPEVKENIKKGEYTRALNIVNNIELKKELTITKQLDKLGNFEMGLRIAQEINEKDQKIVDPLFTVVNGTIKENKISYNLYRGINLFQECHANIISKNLISKFEDHLPSFFLLIHRPYDPFQHVLILTLR